MTHETLEVFLRGLKLLKLQLTQKQLQQFSVYLEELIKWNDKFNLIGPATDEEIVTKHFLDSLSIIPVLSSIILATKPLAGRILPTHCFLDVGTGAGFPGLPLKIAKPEISLTLLDSSKKKTEFLRHLLKKLDIEAEVICARAENVAKRLTKKYDVVVSRAMAKPSVSVGLRDLFVNETGVLILQVGEKTYLKQRQGEVMQTFCPLKEILPGKVVLSIKRKIGGFTLIELMIAVTIVGILSVIIIPKFVEVMKRTKEGQTKGELGTIRSAISIYYGEMEGMFYPQNANAISNENGPFQTKYLSKMPSVKLGPHTHDETTDMDNFNDGDAPTDLGNWGYIASSGKVFVNCSHLDTKGELITTW